MDFMATDEGVAGATVDMSKGISATYDARRLGETQTSTFYSQADVKDEDEPTDSQGD
jgi:hypothetical protein